MYDHPQSGQSAKPVPLPHAGEPLLQRVDSIERNVGSGFIELMARVEQQRLRIEKIEALLHGEPPATQTIGTCSP